MYCGCRAVSFFVARLNLDVFGPCSGTEANNRNSGLVGCDLLISFSRDTDPQISARRGPVWIRGEDENLVLQIGDERASLGNGCDQQRRFADRDRLAASLSVPGGILYCGLN